MLFSLYMSDSEWIVRNKSHLESSVKAGGKMLFNKSFSLHLVKQVSAHIWIPEGPIPFFPHTGNEWRAECYIHHVLFVVPVTSQMNTRKTASSPSWFFLSGFSNGVGNSGASRKNQLQRVQLHCLHDKFYLYFYRQMVLNWKFCSYD